MGRIDSFGSNRIFDQIKNSGSNRIFWPNQTELNIFDFFAESSHLRRLVFFVKSEICC